MLETCLSCTQSHGKLLSAQKNTGFTVLLLARPSPKLEILDCLPLGILALDLDCLQAEALTMPSFEAFTHSYGEDSAVARDLVQRRHAKQNITQVLHLNPILQSDVTSRYSLLNVQLNQAWEETMLNEL